MRILKRDIKMVYNIKNMGILCQLSRRFKIFRGLAIMFFFLGNNTRNRCTWIIKLNGLRRERQCHESATNNKSLISVLEIGSGENFRGEIHPVTCNYRIGIISNECRLNFLWVIVREIVVLG